MARSTSNWLLAAALFVAPTAASADVVFTDGAFDLANYSESPEFNSGTVSSFQQCAGCGNPGAGLQISILAPSGTGRFSIAFINDSFAYNPATKGPIASILASIDKNSIVNWATHNFGSTFRPTIEQDGNFYLAAISGPVLNTGPGGGSTGYHTISQSGLTAADFQQYDFTAGSFVTGMPNFAGDPMLLGFSHFTNLAGDLPPGATFVGEFDNLVLGISTVPEPPAFVLLAAALLSLAGVGLARRE